MHLNGHAAPASAYPPQEAWNGAAANGRHDEDAAFGRYQQRYAEPEIEANGAEHHPSANGHEHDAPTNGARRTIAQEPVEPQAAPSPELVADEPLYAHAPARAAAGSPVLGSFRRAWTRLLPGGQDRSRETHELRRRGARHRARAASPAGSRAPATAPEFRPLRCPIERRPRPIARRRSIII